MRILRSLAIAFAMYSRIPTPRVEWNSENMRFAACFLPFVGAVIAGLEYLLFWGGGLLGLSPLVRALLAAAIPILVTGGIHLDGFMDTKDALNSYKSKEEKQKILKDSRVGAFAVIRLALFFLVFLAAAAELASLPVKSSSGGILFCALAGFILSRTVAAFFLIFGKKAKKEGFAYMFASAADRRACGAILSVETVLVVGLMMLFSPLTALFALIFMTVYSIWFLKMADREFGGLSGDLLGMAITELELIAFLAAALTAIL